MPLTCRQAEHSPAASTRRERRSDFGAAPKRAVGRDNELIVLVDRPPDIDAEIKTTDRLGGLLRSYRRAD